MKPEFELSESKWSLLKQLENEPLSPKELADLTNTSVANTSQQLKLLEAQGFLKKVKNKGVRAREERDARVLYSISKPKFLITKISKDLVNRDEIKNCDDFITNLLFCNLKELNHVLKFFLVHEDLMAKIKCLYYLQTIDSEVHFLILTDDLDYFRKSTHSFDVTHANKKIVIKFWSHSMNEFKVGLDKNETYYVDLVKRAFLLKCDDENVKNLFLEWK